MKKKFIVFILMAIFCFTLTGCAKIDYTFLNDGKKLTQIFSVEIDNEKLTQSGVNPLEIKTIVNEKILKHLTIYNASYESAVNTLMLNDHIDVKTANLLKEAVVTQAPIWLNNKVSCQLTFNTVVSDTQTIEYMNVYYLYYQGELYPEVEESDIQTDGMIRRLTENDFTIFNSSIASTYKQDIESALTDAEIEVDEDIKYSYTYGTQFRRVHSDADSISYDGTYYLHSWNLENAEEKITLYRIYANQWIWYIIAAGIGILTAGILLIVCLVKKKKANRIEVEIITPDD